MASLCLTTHLKIFTPFSKMGGPFPKFVLERKFFRSRSLKVEFSLAGNFFQKWPRYVFFNGVESRGFGAVKAQAGAWKEVTDAASGKPYYWNTATNETSWTLPESDSSSDAQQTPNVPNEEVLATLLSADSDRFGDVADRFRPQCFEDEFSDFLNAKIDSTSDAGERERLEKLRARLANPLLKNPPPY